MAENKEKIAYTVHPVSDELKKELRGKGLKILDARFAGESDKIYNLPKEDQDQAPNEGTNDWYKMKLTDAKVEFDDNATKAILTELYDSIGK